MAIDDIKVMGIPLYGDLNADNIVDGSDLPAFMVNWLMDNEDLELNGDGVIGLYEFAEFADNWLVESFQ